MLKVYSRFLIFIFLKSLFFIICVMLSLAFILNLLTEIDFFKDTNSNSIFPIFLSILNSPDLVFEMLPFIFLITAQLFFIKLFENREIEIFKYSGLNNIGILKLLIYLSFFLGIFFILIFYNISSSLKNVYLELKSPYTSDGKYLAVITKNGLWIKDKLENKIHIINSSRIEKNFLVNNFITIFDENFKIIKNIRSNKIDISKKNWLIYDAKIFNKNEYIVEEKITLNTNFNLERINTLYSNLSALNIHALYELRKNYVNLNYSLTEVDMQILKLITYPFYLMLMTLFSSLLMYRIKEIKGTTYKIAIGLFFSVIIYYLNNFSIVLGTTDRIPTFISILMPLFTILIINIMMIYKINDK